MLTILILGVIALVCSLFAVVTLDTNATMWGTFTLGAVACITAIVVHAAFSLP